MKKLLLVLIFAFLFSGSFLLQSCNKCATCHYTYTNAQGELNTFAYAEVCGNNNDVNDYKDACVAAAALYTNGSCTCVDD